ncbi:hypothetical protein OKA05_07835 [Luteolibacter arcticus]|uniref:Uncharacterized protein n=1 Tax=Luteolibacter arcticus TaxID=1581411 RepID=A0ABT3GG68_9BACT|nr:hypothetical protein [Luteolibacter arcticus]MCW1922461.1 hypothetical protein [Luteolibacter arcticus]
MKDSTKLILCSLLFVLAGVIAFLAPKYQTWRSARLLEDLETLPLKSTLSIRGSDITSPRHTWSVGNYGVTDVGHLRLVFEDLPFSGTSSSGSLTLGTKSSGGGGGGSSGVGNRTFEYDSIPGGSRCRFGGATFEIVGGQLTLAGTTVDATGAPSLVLIGKDRKIREVKPLRLAAP